MGIIEPRPALVPLTLAGYAMRLRDISGVAADVVAQVGKTKFCDAALRTHRGLSGRSILQISSDRRHGQPLATNFLPYVATDGLSSQTIGARKGPGLYVTGWLGG
jgi:predicted flavoprotein YhiN